MRSSSKLLVALCISLSPAAVAQQRLWTGDVDGNGSIDVADAFATLRAAAGKLALSPEESARADVDHDGRVTAADALALINVTTMPVARPPFDAVPENFPEIHASTRRTRIRARSCGSMATTSIRSRRTSSCRGTASSDTWASARREVFSFAFRSPQPAGP